MIYLPAGSAVAREVAGSAERWVQLQVLGGPPRPGGPSSFSRVPAIEGHRVANAVSRRCTIYRRRAPARAKILCGRNMLWSSDCEPTPSCCSRRLLVQKTSLNKRHTDALDLGGAELDERRAHHGAREPAEQNQRFLHPVMHVDERVGVEGAGKRVDTVVHRLGGAEVVRRYGPEQLRLQVGDDAAGARQQALAAEHQRGEQPRRMSGEHVHGPRQRLQRAHLPFVKLHVVGPVFDGADRRHCLSEPQQSLRRIALAGRKRILERDDGQIRGLRNAGEMRDRHFGVLPEGERRRRKHQQRRRAARSRSTRNPGGLLAAVRPYAVHDRQLVADLTGRYFHDATLLLERAASDLGRVGIDRNRAKPVRRRDLAQMSAKASFVDRKVVREGQQYGRNDALGNEGRVVGHEGLLTAWPEQVAARTPAGEFSRSVSRPHGQNPLWNAGPYSATGGGKGHRERPGTGCPARPATGAFLGYKGGSTSLSASPRVRRLSVGIT